MGKYSKGWKNIICALLLVQMYTVHLGLFDALMIIPQHFKASQSEVNGYSTNHDNQKGIPSSFMAAYYQSLLKHEDGKKYTFLFDALYSVLSVFILLPFVLNQNVAVKIVSFVRAKLFTLCEYAYKRFMRLNVLLV